jgi:competence protein ComEA
MSFLKRYSLPIFGLSSILNIFILVFVLHRVQSFNFRDTVCLESLEEENVQKIEITGAVKYPGEYILSESMSINDLIIKSGGLLDGADLEYLKTIDLSKDLNNGEKVFIPLSTQSLKCECDNSVIGKEKVNINTATVEELDTLPGIGPSYAKKIVEGRPYSTIEEIKNIKGIGTSTYNKLKDQITI